jgi:hypothetical protein
MADNVPITAGVGTDVATDEVGGVHYQRVKPSWGADGAAVDVSEAAPLPVAAYGELVEAVQSLRMIAHAIDRSIGQAYANVAGRLLVEASLAATQTLGAVTTVSTVTNQTQVGGIGAAAQIPALMGVAADSLRRNVSVTA